MDNIRDFKSFYNLHEAFVRKSLHYIIKNENKVDDIVQEVFIKVWKKSNSFENKSSLKTWLYRITVNCAYDHLRKEKRHESSSIELNDTHEKKYSTDLSNKDLIKKGISKLDDKLKSVFVLFYINQVHQDEISAALKIPIGTVKSRLSKARTIVSEYLKEQGVNYGK